MPDPATGGGRSTQVVLFTHRDPIVDMERRQAGAAILATPTAAPQRDHVVAGQEVVVTGTAPANATAARP